MNKIGKMKYLVALLVAAAAFLAAAPESAKAEREVGTVTQVRWFAAGNFGFVRLSTPVTDDSGSCTSNFVHIGGDVPGHEQIIKLATAALLSGREVQVRTYSGCDDDYPRMSALYLK